MKVLVVEKSSDIPTSPVDGKPTLAYWRTLGLTQAIRLSLVAAKVDFVDVRLVAGDPNLPTYKGIWFSVKERTMPSAGFAFPNLPYYMDGEVKLSQSNTILRYIGNKYNMMGCHIYETDQILDVLSDLEWKIVHHAYFVGPNELFQWYAANAASAVETFSTLAKDAFLFGASEPSVADYKLYVLLYRLRVIQKQLGNADTAHIVGGDWLQAFMRRIETIPAISEYMASSNYMRAPCNNPAAKWQG